MLWRVFFATTFFQRNSPYENCWQSTDHLICTLWKGAEKNHHAGLHRSLSHGRMNGEGLRATCVRRWAEEGLLLDHSRIEHNFPWVSLGTWSVQRNTGPPRRPLPSPIVPHTYMWMHTHTHMHHGYTHTRTGICLSCERLCSHGRGCPPAPGRGISFPLRESSN